MWLNDSLCGLYRVKCGVNCTYPEECVFLSCLLSEMKIWECGIRLVHYLDKA